MIKWLRICVADSNVIACHYFFCSAKATRNLFKQNIHYTHKDGRGGGVVATMNFEFNQCSCLGAIMQTNIAQQGILRDIPYISQLDSLNS